MEGLVPYMSKHTASTDDFKSKDSRRNADQQNPAGMLHKPSMKSWTNLWLQSQQMKAKCGSTLNSLKTAL